MTIQPTTPLAKLPIASLDLETTGLAPRRDRIVQIGMVSPHQKNAKLDILVNPGIAIPAKSTSIHNITDEMVANENGIAHALPRLRDAISGKIVLGYNIGFDLAVLEAEAQRCGLDWEWEAALCVRQLSHVALGSEAGMMLGDLESLADYYNIKTGKRHNALGDAIITADVFAAMLPDLEKNSITTLADAMRAVSALDSMRMETARAGWVDVAALPGNRGGGNARAVERIDPYPYRYRIGDIMLKDPAIFPRETKIRAVAEAMKKTGLDCVFVGKDAHHIEGIVSERDIVMTMAIPTGKVKLARDMPIGDVMSSPVITVGEDDFMHVALGRISRLDIRHLGVMSASGVLTGWISARELTRQRTTEALVIGDSIADAGDAGAIAAALSALPIMAESLLEDNVPAHLIAAVISSQYRAAAARAAMLAEKKMKTRPPRDYALLVLGSAGRGESLLAADQDHAIIYDGKADKKTQGFFETLGGHIADILDASGIPYCTGGVMAREPKWCRSLDGWKKAIAEWVQRASMEDMLAVDIFFDFVVVHGSAELGNALRKTMQAKPTRDAEFLKRLAGDVASGSGKTILGGLRSEEGRYDIKKYLLLPLIQTMRVLAISRGIGARSSANRADELLKSDTVPAEVPLLAEDIHFALRLVLRQQIRDMSAGLAPGTKIEVDAIGKDNVKRIKTILDRVDNLDALLQTSLFAR